MAKKSKIKIKNSKLFDASFSASLKKLMKLEDLDVKSKYELVKLFKAVSNTCDNIMDLKKAEDIGEEEMKSVLETVESYEFTKLKQGSFMKHLTPMDLYQLEDLIKA